MEVQEKISSTLRELFDSRGSEDDFVALKPPKRGGSRESIPNAANALRRGYIDQVASTDESLRASWRYGCYLFNNCCYICGEPFAAGSFPQADHVVPPELGGSTNAGNMLPAHSSCNDRKGNSSPEEFFKGNPPVLEILEHFRKRYNFVPDPTLYPLAHEKVNGYIEVMKRDILASRNARELALEDLGEDLYSPAPGEITPAVKNLLRGVGYYLQSKSFAPSARDKMLIHTRRILQLWDKLRPEEDLFSSDEETIRKFIEVYCKRLNDHPDTFNRTHRAFRILGTVFDSRSLTNIYTEGCPVSLGDLRETHLHTAEGWVPLP